MNFSAPQRRGSAVPRDWMTFAPAGGQSSHRWIKTPKKQKHKSMLLFFLCKEEGVGGLS